MVKFFLGASRSFSLGLALLLGTFLSMTAPGWTIIQSVGPYTVDIDVRTTLMFSIPSPFVQCKLSGNRIRVWASAAGFVPQEKEIPVKPGIVTYKEYLILKDREKRFDVFDFQNKPIASCFFDRHQGGTPPDRYAITMFLPVQSWPHPSPANIIVNQPGYGIPIQESCEISIKDEFYKIRMLIDRRVLDDPNDELIILVNTSAVMEPTLARKWISHLRNLETTHPCEAETLGRALLHSLPEDIDQNSLPRCLVRLVQERNRFSDLHERKQGY